MAFGKHGIDWNSTFAAIWRGNNRELKPVRDVDLVDLDKLVGIDDQKEELCRNTENFLQGKPTNHVLLWGVPGTGKSALIKGILNKYKSYKLRVIEVARENLADLADISDEIRDLNHKFILYCDGLSFKENDVEYHYLKVTLEGSIERPPENIRVYAISTTRNFKSDEEEQNIASLDQVNKAHNDCLTDHFGISLSFMPMTEDIYLKIVDNLLPNYIGDRDELHRSALKFAKRKPYYNGRTAVQFFRYYSGL